MFDNSEALLRQIHLGEDTSLELTSVRFRGEKVAAPRRDDLADELAAIANTHDDPQPVLKVEIPRSLYVHESPGGYYFRQGSSKRKMAPDHLARLFQQRSQARLVRFDVAGACNRLGPLVYSSWRWSCPWARFIHLVCEGSFTSTAIHLDCHSPRLPSTSRPFALAD